MSKKNESDQKLIKEIMLDSKNQSDLYMSGNYWNIYEKNILKQIEENDLTKFRSWPGGAGVGNIQSFGGGEKQLARSFGKHFHPFDMKFLKLDNFPLIRKYNSFINRLSKKLPFFSYFAFRAAEARQYFFSAQEELQRTWYNLIFNLDKDLLEISDSTFGNPIGFYKKDKFYTNQFLRELTHVHFVKKNTDFNKIESIIELGSGIGLLASCFLKLKKNVKYLLIDIAPMIFFSEYYLRNLGFKVCGYKELKNMKNPNLNKIFEEYQVCCIPSWKLELLKDYKSDLFINVASFQEMENDQSKNYINIIKKSVKQGVYLSNKINGHHKSVKKDMFGVLKATTKLSIENELKYDFKIKESQIFNDEYGGEYKTLFQKKSF